MIAQGQDFELRVARIIEIYGEGDNAGAPSQAGWRALGALPAAQPVTLVNFFKLREHAFYSDRSGAERVISGQAAFDRYAEVSMPSLAKVGGRFLLVAPFAAAFVGADLAWDLVAIGAYPQPSAVLDLFERPEYAEVFRHRTAACAAQRVSICAG
ncbi:MAG: DUF1330 domain-containing protein [Neomegalonema sp.]|nr:DUF1330 domain-containing protein [Neomegalonema sp.]